MSGLNGLLDNLIKIGLIGESDAVSKRMMLAMFTRPGEGPDTQVSDIEFQPGGTILANGQRIK